MQLFSLLLSSSLLYTASAGIGNGVVHYYVTSHSSDSRVDLKHLGVNGDNLLALVDDSQLQFFIDSRIGLVVSSEGPNEYAQFTSDNTVAITSVEDPNWDRQLRQGQGRDFFICLDDNVLYFKQAPSSCSNAVSVTLTLDDPHDSYVIPAQTAEGYGSHGLPMTVPAYTNHPW